jgi:peroxiredoxin
MRKFSLLLFVATFSYSSLLAQESYLELQFEPEEPKKSEIIAVSLKGKNTLLDFRFNRQRIPITGLDGPGLLRIELIKGTKGIDERFFWIGPGSLKLTGKYNSPESWRVSPSHPYQEIFDQIESTSGDTKKKEITKNLDNPVGLERLYFYSDLYSNQELLNELALVPERLLEDMNYGLLEGILAKKTATKLKEGQQFLDFVLENRSGKVTQISELSGKFILLDFASSNCFPCFKALPELAKIYDEFSDQLEIVSIWFDPNKKVWLENSKKLKDQISWIDLWDPTGKIHSQYGAVVLPYYTLINPKGEILHIWNSYTAGRIERKVKSFLSTAENSN